MQKINGANCFECISKNTRAISFIKEKDLRFSIAVWMKLLEKRLCNGMAAESMFTGNIELVMHTMLNKLKE